MSNYASIAGQMEAFMSSARQLEAALAAERQNVQKLQADLRDSQALHERLLREERDRFNEIKHQSAQLRTQVAQNIDRERAIHGRLQSVTDAHDAAKKELDHYKAAWSGVLQREREAKMVLAESDTIRRRLTEAEGRVKALEEAHRTQSERRAQAERHANTYQSELQHALVRIHSAESKFAEISKEMQAIQQSKRNADEEIARLEHSMRERMQWEIAREKEKIRAEVERNAALERERFREELRATLGAEDREKAERLKIELETLSAESRALIDHERRCRARVIAFARKAGRNRRAAARAARLEVAAKGFETLKALTEAQKEMKDARRQAILDLAAADERVSKLTQAIEIERNKANDEAERARGLCEKLLDERRRFDLALKNLKEAQGGGEMLERLWDGIWENTLFAGPEISGEILEAGPDESV